MFGNFWNFVSGWSGGGTCSESGHWDFGCLPQRGRSPLPWSRPPEHGQFDESWSNQRAVSGVLDTRLWLAGLRRGGREGWVLMEKQEDNGIDLRLSRHSRSRDHLNGNCCPGLERGKAALNLLDYVCYTNTFRCVWIYIYIYMAKKRPFFFFASHIRFFNRYKLR